MTYPCTECIIDMLESTGPQEAPALRRECRTQAVPYTPELFQTALDSLTGTGRIVIEVSELDGTTSYYYDLPDSYYTATI